MILKEMNEIQQAAVNAAKFSVNIANAWAGAIMDTLKMFTLILQKKKELALERQHDSIPFSSPTVNLDKKDNNPTTKPPQTMPVTWQTSAIKPQQPAVKQPEFRYDNDYPVVLTHKNQVVSPKQQLLKVIEKSQGWVIVFEDKIAYQPKPGAWLTQQRSGPILSDMLKCANQQFVGQNAGQQYVEVSGYDTTLSEQLRSYVSKQPALSLQPENKAQIENNIVPMLSQ